MPKKPKTPPRRWGVYATKKSAYSVTKPTNTKKGAKKRG